MAGGDHPNIRWLNARIEDAALAPPYALIIAGASFHWMQPDVTLRRFAEVISARGMFAILDGDAPIDPPWQTAEQAIMLDIVTKMEGAPPKWWATASARLHIPHTEHPQFKRVGVKVTAPMRFSQSIADYLRCQHSRATWSEEHMGEDRAREFDDAMIAMLTPHAHMGVLTYSVQTRLEWGRPLAREGD